jgi:hypothetical protein
VTLGAAGVALATVLAFYGYVRFTFVLDPYLLPFAAAAVVELVRRSVRPGADGVVSA